MEQVLEEVRAERERQDARWGVQDHEPCVYMAILTEEVGEAAQAAVEHRFRGAPLANVRAELVQVAAVAVAMVEAIDRRESDPSTHDENLTLRGANHAPWTERARVRAAVRYLVGHDRATPETVEAQREAIQELIAWAAE